MNKSHSTLGRKAGGFSLSAARSPKHTFEQMLRLKGVLTEGYNPATDAYEREIHLPFGLRLCKTIRAFSGASAPAPVYTTEAVRQRRTPPKLVLERPGVKMYFADARDMAARMWQVTDSDGYDLCPKAPFIVKNLVTQKLALFAPERIALHAARKPGLPNVLPLAA